MDIEVVPAGDEINVVRLNGRLDSPGVDQVETRFMAAAVASNKHTAVDLSGVTFLASMGIRMLISSARSMQQKGRKLSVFGASEPVQGVLDSVALDQLIPVTASREQAVAALAG
jgi:anti-anti-sigma factor